MNKTLHTKFGIANQESRGYYKITSSKEGNHGKYLHRLIYEDFWGVKLPKEIHIHHRNGNKKDNCILNLEAMTESEHKSHHMSSKNPMDDSGHTLKSMINRSASTNTTGYFRVSKCKNKEYKQGFVWVYSYYENGQRVHFQSSSISKLKEKILDKGLIWCEL